MNDLTIKNDPTVEYVPIEIEGKTYQMAFDLGSLADAEAELISKGIQVNLLRCLNFENLTLNSVRTLFACGLRKAQPEIAYEDACALVTVKTVYGITNTLYEAWLKSVGSDAPDLEKKVELKVETGQES